MSGSNIEVDTKVLGNGTAGPVHVDANFSFRWLLGSTAITTLSTNANSLTTAPEGFLYVPSLANGTACYNASQQYVSQTVTRRNGIPGSTTNVVAIAPWISADCTSAYLQAARTDQVRSFLFYLPDPTIVVPPPATDPVWSLNDQNAWKSTFPYPVFAIPGDAGQSTVDKLASYSGNVSAAPESQYLVNNYGTNATVRLYVTIGLNLTTGLPSLWIFLVIVVAVLISVVGTVSATMHWIQRRRRRDLQRRIANGEVDLETIGIKRLMVPAAILDKMPLYSYKKVDPTAPGVQEVESNTSPVTNAGITEKGGIPVNHFDQPTCAICLDDFIPDESQVRELPCGHIFHPECVDHFLTQVSSLCPLCKKSALPKGYCPAVVTNLMVRRERILRRERNQAGQQGTETSQNDNTALARFRRRSRLGDIEMNPRRASTAVNGTSAVSTDSATRPNTQLTAEERAARARQRAEELVGPNAAPHDPEEGQSRVPAWRRGLRKVFPAR